ncbi:S8 family peptidase [Bacillus paranthracis]|uniref:S8 family peptidase n=1 Tax=Bacillus paranthracis TaxID=2026186 RepID=UPI00019FB6F2|nr:hypothetical protein bcere0001_6800 [Bacillus cereus m1293]
MEPYEHLPLSEYRGESEKRKDNRRGGGYRPIGERDKNEYYSENIRSVSHIAQSFSELKQKFRGKINPHLIYRLKVNQGVDYNGFGKILNSLGGLTVLSVAEDKKGYWVVFSNDEEFAILKNKIAQYSGITAGAKYDFFNAIDGIEDIPIEEKVGEIIKREPLVSGETYYLNIELWRMEDEELAAFIEQLENTYTDYQTFKICDKLITKSFALLRVKIRTEILNEILELKEIARVDKPFIPTFNPYTYHRIDVEDLNIEDPPTDAMGILVVDSGIVSNHPLLEKAVGAEENFQEGEQEIQDVAGHGTAIAGSAIYGDINECIANKTFAPSNWVFSAKVMYCEQGFNGITQAVYDKEKLLETQLNDAIRYFLNSETYKIKVVNISFGNMDEVLRHKDNRQFPLAALIDELAYEYNNVIFVISTGNQDPRNLFELTDIIDSYPDYFINNEDFKIINPATSALALAVGSVAPNVRISGTTMFGADEELWSPIALESQPSPFTRAGFGINGMVKPELVHYGGNLILKDLYGRIQENPGGKIPLLSNNPSERIFSIDKGTSYAAPQVTNLIGKIVNKFPNKSADFIKNLVLQSADECIDPGFNADTSSEKFKSLLKVTGYGVPSYEKAINSFDNRIMLLDEGTIGLNKVKFFTVNLPVTFFETKGRKKIAVALTFTPLTRATRGDSYLGNRMEFKLFHSVSSQTVIEKFSQLNLEENQEQPTPPDLAGYEVELIPGVNMRKMGCHQKGWKEYKREPKNCPKAPLTLVLMNTNKWIPDENYQQRYCISIVVEHAAEISLYNEIRTTLQQRVRIR